jgi:hypothetical protein
VHKTVQLKKGQAFFEMQRGQIERTTASWAIVYCGQLVEKYRNIPILWATFFLRKLFVYRL